MKRSLVILISLFIAFSCTSHHKQTTDEIGDLIHLQRIDKNHNIIDIENAKFVDYESIVEDVKYVPLGTEEGYLTMVDEILYYKEKYYIADIQQEVVFIFDEKGKCIKKIANKGKGQGEYIGVGNIEIDKEKSELIITDRFVNKFLFYNLDGGFKYMKRFKNQIQINNSFLLKDSTFVHQAQSFQNRGIKSLENYGCFISKGDSIINKGFKYLPSQIGYCGGPNLRRGYNCIYFRPIFSDSIYCINNDSTFSLTWSVKLKKSIWKRNYKSPEFINMYNQIGDKLHNIFYETESFFIGYTNSDDGDNMDWVIYDKNKNVTHLSKVKRYVNIEQLDRFYGYDIRGVKDDYFIILSSSFSVEDDLKLNLETGKLKVTDSELAKIIRDSDYGDNPILILTKFKSV